MYDASKDKSICQVCVVEGDADSAATSEGRLCGMEVSGKYPTNLKVHLKASIVSLRLQIVFKPTQAHMHCQGFLHQ